MTKNQVALPQGCIYNAATDTPDPAADAHQEDRVARVSVQVKDDIKQQEESKFCTISRSFPPPTL